MHPLQYGWTFYAHYESESNNYGSSYETLGTFDTVEDFWRLFNNIPNVNVLTSREKAIITNSHTVIAFSMFKNNIKPEWEEIENKNGSEWSCRQEISDNDIEYLWRNMCLDCIGGNIDVIGIRVVNKNNPYKNMSKLELWMSKIQDPVQVYTEFSSSFRGLEGILQNDIPVFTLLYHDNKKDDYNSAYMKRKKKHKNLW